MEVSVSRTLAPPSTWRPSERVEDRHGVEVVAPVSDLAIGDREYRDVPVRVRGPVKTTRPAEAYDPARSPNYNAVCERFQGTALQECWRPAFHRRRFISIRLLQAEIDP